MEGSTGWTSEANATFVQSSVARGGPRASLCATLRGGLSDGL